MIHWYTYSIHICNQLLNAGIERLDLWPTSYIDVRRVKSEDMVNDLTNGLFVTESTLKSVTACSERGNFANTL